MKLPHPTLNHLQRHLLMQGVSPKGFSPAQRDSCSPNKKALLFVNYQISLSKFPGLLAVQMFMPLEKDSRKFSLGRWVRSQ